MHKSTKGMIMIIMMTITVNTLLFYHYYPTLVEFYEELKALSFCTFHNLMPLKSKVEILITLDHD